MTLDQCACVLPSQDTTDLPPSHVLPDYQGGSIVNLMTSVVMGLGGASSLYPPLRDLDPLVLGASRNVALMVIDGLGYHHLTAKARQTHFHRHLRGRMTSVFPSTTATAVTTFLTGEAPQQHGLTGWHVYLEELGGVTAVLPLKRRNGPPVSKRSVLDTARVFEPRPICERIPVTAYIVAPNGIIDSPYNAAYSGKAVKRPYHALQDFFRVVARTLKENEHRKYVYAYYPEIDRLAHEHGIGSRQVAGHLADLDAAFGWFLRQAAGTDTTVIVTADHGFLDTRPERRIDIASHPALTEALRLPLCGESRAAYCYVRPEKRGQFKSAVETQLAGRAEIVESAALIEQGYFGFGPAHPLLRERVGDYTLIMQDDYTIKDWLPGEERYNHIGVHGGMSEEEMFVPLIVANVK
jgi:hypothetical protein